MLTIFEDQAKFMVACGQTVYEENPAQFELYKKLILEEIQELFDAKDNVEELDAIMDIIVVCTGALLSTDFIKSNPDEVNFNDIAYQATTLFKFEKKVFNELFILHLIDDGFEDLKMYDKENNICLFTITQILTRVFMLLNVSGRYDIIGAWNEVVTNNMSKVCKETGKVIKRDDGKILKPEGWKPPDFSKYVRV